MEKNKNAIIQSGGSINVGSNLSIGDEKIVIHQGTGEMFFDEKKTWWFIDAKIKLQNNQTDEALAIMRSHLSDEPLQAMAEQVKCLTTIRIQFESKSITHQIAAHKKREINQRLIDIINEHLEI